MQKWRWATVFSLWFISEWAWNLSNAESTIFANGSTHSQFFWGLYGQLETDKTFEELAEQIDVFDDKNLEWDKKDKAISVIPDFSLC